MTRLAVAAILGFAFALAALSSAAAQAPDVIISQLNCTGDPELVVVTNQAGAAQSLSGWKLRSDPEANEVFDLSGSLPGNGASITIQSGPSASGIFVWSTSEVFRDGDASDFVRLVNNTGATVQQVDCPGGATPTATPAPSPVGEVPNGGGPPPLPVDLLSPGMMILMGGSLVAAGFGAIALPWLRLRPSPVAVSPPSRRRSAAGRPARRGRGGHGGKPGYSAVSLAAAVFTAVMVFRFLRRSSD